jgi:hypothetical protein
VSLLRDLRALARDHLIGRPPAPMPKTEMGRTLKRFDDRLPEHARPRRTMRYCYRQENGEACNQPIYMRRDGSLFCYDHDDV